MFLCVCAQERMCVYVLLCLCARMGSQASGSTGSMILHREGMEFSLISPKEINTHNLSASCRLSLKNSLQAQYGNVVKWPTGISDRIRPQKLGSQADFPASEFRYILPVFQNAGCGTCMFPLNIHLNVRWPCLLHACMCVSRCVCLCWTQNQWSEKAHPAIWL